MIFKNRPDIELNEELVKRNKVPLLIKDPLWKSMSVHIKDRKIGALSKKLEQLIKEEKMNEAEINKFKKKKTEITKNILEMSHHLNENDQYHLIDKMNKTKEELQKTNQHLENAYEKRERMPVEIQNANMELLSATVEKAALHLVKENEAHQKVEVEIEQVRNKLNLLRENKEKAEERIQLYYQFLHSLLGPEQMEKLDNQIQYTDGKL
ncbi:hypothetical protein [Tindallia californiensis]|uniref:Uncharacterized protein n=1 Tax=Tindallia californiensis TaxID=159292 RepID=A0A1H3K6K6_9FIRM|nr:hypothetical protein [Tindallia californiensis]SDY47144.1 hypothetical protein SAMN05192546_102225 [Tindallia californiensis]